MQSQRLVSLSFHGKHFHGKHFHQELKGNGDGSFDGRVQRKTERAGWERQAGREPLSTHTGQAKAERDTEVWAAVLRET